MKTTMRIVLALVMLTLGLTVMAQDAKKLYTEGKALYDQEKYTEAVPKLKASAEKGYKKAQYRLGRCYDKGRGVAEDDKKAFYWYQKAAAQDYAKGQYHLGRCYKKGKGVEKNHQKAYSWFLKAARQDYGEAQLALAECYLKGKGTKENRDKARQWAVKAVNNEKDGAEVLQQLRENAADGDEDAKALLQLTGKK